jgi:predicted HicB family RNase H-like nuclease
MSTRPNLFEEDDDLDLSVFAPRPEAALNAPSAEQVRTVTEAARFPSRQATTAPEPRKPRRWRTGRTAQFNCRITPEAFAAFYAIADQQNWTVGATVENALAALKEKLGMQKV